MREQRINWFLSTSATALVWGIPHSQRFPVRPWENAAHVDFVTVAAWLCCRRTGRSKRQAAPALTLLPSTICFTRGSTMGAHGIPWEGSPSSARLDAVPAHPSLFHNLTSPFLITQAKDLAGKAACPAWHPLTRCLSGITTCLSTNPEVRESPTHICSSAAQELPWPQPAQQVRHA